ncbi:MAG: glycosyltransferase N-terminal domain-containing protein [Candidatus Eisenbacteria bacterium]
MAVEEPQNKRSWLSRLLFGIYRYVPLGVYFVILAIYHVFPPARARLAERLAMRRPSDRGRPVIWFHASSMGEISTIAPVVAEIRRKREDCAVVVSTMTVSGGRRAREILNLHDVFLLPIDFYPCMKRLIRGLKPATLIIGETEIWPNMISEARKQGVRIVLLNGRISRKSFPRYRLIRPLIKDVLSGFDLLLMRTQTDAIRITHLGADPGRVEVAGNTKYDILPGPSSPAHRKDTRRGLKIPEGQKVITLGSAREGECEIVLGALAEAGIEPPPMLVIAPRHLVMVDQIEQICRDFGRRYRTLSGGGVPERDDAAGANVIIIAEMGRLLDMYAISDIAIVGGTYRPFGGHNPLESASQGVVTIVGPHTQNIEDDIEYLRSRECAFIAGEHDLGPLLLKILSDDARRDRMGRDAAEAVEAMKGIAKKCVEIMARKKLLP